MTVYINDRFVEDKDAVLQLKDLSMQRGYAVFDYFRTINGVPLFADDHLDRFFSSAATLHLTPGKSRDEIKAIAQQLIDNSGWSEAGIRLMLTGGYSADGYQLAAPNLIISCNKPTIAAAADFEKGYSVITHQHQRELPQVKSINYLTAVWLQPLLKEKQANDVLYFNNESITEFPRANIVMVTADDKLITPAHNILKGITRKNILSLAVKTMTVEERNIPMEELLTAKEIFLSATTKKIIPVIAIDGKKIGDGRPGTVTTQLYKQFLELEQSLTKK